MGLRRSRSLGLAVLPPLRSLLRQPPGRRAALAAGRPRRRGVRGVGPRAASCPTGASRASRCSSPGREPRSRPGAAAGRAFRIAGAERAGGATRNVWRRSCSGRRPASSCSFARGAGDPRRREVHGPRVPQLARALPGDAAARPVDVRKDHQLLLLGIPPGGRRRPSSRASVSPSFADVAYNLSVATFAGLSPSSPRRAWASGSRAGASASASRRRVGAVFAGNVAAARSMPWARRSPGTSTTGTRRGSSRDGNTINEFPFFTFFHADLHPHLLAFPYFVAAFAVAHRCFERGSSSARARAADRLRACRRRSARPLSSRSWRARRGPRTSGTRRPSSILLVSSGVFARRRRDAGFRRRTWRSCAAPSRGGRARRPARPLRLPRFGSFQPREPGPRPRRPDLRAGSSFSASGGVFFAVADRWPSGRRRASDGERTPAPPRLLAVALAGGGALLGRVRHCGTPALLPDPLPRRARGASRRGAALRVAGRRSRRASSPRSCSSCRSR